MRPSPDLRPFFAAALLAGLAFPARAAEPPPRRSIEEKRGESFLFFQESLNEKARSRARDYAAEMLGTDVSIRSATVYADSGLGELSGVVVSVPTNAPGRASFREPLLRIRTVVLNARSDFIDDVDEVRVIHDLEIRGVELSLEGNTFETGFDALFDRVASEAAKAAGKPVPKRKRCIVERLLVEDFSVRRPLPDGTTLVRPVPAVLLENLGADEDGLSKWPLLERVLSVLREKAFAALRDAPAAPSDPDEIPVLGLP